MERQLVRGTIDDEEFGYLDFNFLCAGFNGFLWLFHQTNDIDDTLGGHSGHVLDHFLGDRLALKGYCLNSRELFSEDNEAAVSLGSDVVDTCSHEDFLASQSFIDVDNLF